ncbi:FadR/GntR family transcriptional regulator [Mycobacterium sp. CPCC 205372]|uniref:FadR family transcriptional regulator n=3 Tax=Mycobacteriaceae TaxID=1762 RepID=A0A9X2YSJ6_9MYCO|nr:MULTISPECIES: FadR/GntR family transcriptional regulator [Mycobacteriaceae]MCV7172444.1 FadR family transcriptional regulator [[Mycobacterium] manitobense]MCZ8382580.1 FadR/GntR family transcriptional regulator [Mycobacterium hippophais]MDO3635569.1 FadR/GntR family transcriptional regulator [Mycolicibacterium arseniciresistens]
MTTTLAAGVVAGLKDKIFTGALLPGHKLPSEAELIEEFGVSRTVVREAVTRLRAEGLVETFQGRGSFVLAVPEPTSFTVESAALRTHRDVLDMVDFRLGVESETAALAAARIDDAGRETIRSALAAFVAAAPEDAVEADFRFHRAVAAVSANRFCLELLDSLGPMMIMLPRTRLGAEYSITDAGHAARVQREHDDIAAAVLAGEPDTARAAMRLHLGNTRRRLAAGR